MDSHLIDLSRNFAITELGYQRQGPKLRPNCKEGFEKPVKKRVFVTLILLCQIIESQYILNLTHMIVKATIQGAPENSLR